MLEKNGMELYQLDISENPLCVYQVSDRLLLPTMNMDESGRNYQKIFDDILKLESMLYTENERFTREELEGHRKLYKL